MLTKARMRGIVGGAAILTLFGGAWCVGAVALQPGHPAWGVPAASFVTLALLGMCSLRWSGSARLPNSQDPAAAAKGKRDGILFGIIFGIEGGLIALTSTLLARSDLGEWIPVATALIVGIHFLPLAHIFEVPLYYWTGCLAVFGVLSCLFIHASGVRVLCVGLVMAATLWMTTVLLLLLTRPSKI